VAVTRYLSSLGYCAEPEPTAASLAEMHRRHLDAVPYENLAIMLGRPDSTDPGETLERIAAGGNAGYCFHHNGAFEVVLRALGYALERWSGHVWGRAIPRLNHLDVRASRPAGAEVAEAHRVLSTPPGGRFTGVLVAMRRDDTGAEVLRGIRHQRTGDGAFARDLASYDDWRAALESLSVSLAGAGEAELRSLHARMLAVHAERAAHAEPAAAGEG
jgi:arylamine N-acetyltransferase